MEQVLTASAKLQGALNLIVMQQLHIKQNDDFLRGKSKKQERNTPNILKPVFALSEQKKLETLMEMTGAYVGKKGDKV